MTSSVCMVSVIRLGILLTTNFKSLDQPWNWADFLMWSNVECSIGIVSGNISPSLAS